MSQTVDDFVRKYYDFAKEGERNTQAPAIFSLAQSALESGWGKTVKGNNMFGIKDTDGINGNEQLIGTTEYHNNPNVKYPVIKAIVKIAPKRWKYSILDYFRKYNSPAESFTDHGRFLRQNKRYMYAFNFTTPTAFAYQITRAGYATDPLYYKKITAVIDMIIKSLAESNDV